MAISNSGSVLIGEAEDDNFFLTKTIFEKLAVSNPLHRAVDGQEVVEYLLRKGKYQHPEDSPRPSLIILNSNMPKKSGLEVLKEIKSNFELCQIPIVIISSTEDQNEILRSYALGANSVIVRPLGLNQLIDTLQVLTQYWFQTVNLPQESGSSRHQKTSVGIN